jgi:hypothetical protein
VIPAIFQPQWYAAYCGLNTSSFLHYAVSPARSADDHLVIGGKESALGALVVQRHHFEAKVPSLRLSRESLSWQARQAYRRKSEKAVGYVFQCQHQVRQPDAKSSPRISWACDIRLGDICGCKERAIVREDHTPPRAQKKKERAREYHSAPILSRRYPRRPRAQFCRHRSLLVPDIRANKIARDSIHFSSQSWRGCELE